MEKKLHMHSGSKGINRLLTRERVALSVPAIVNGCALAGLILMMVFCNNQQPVVQALKISYPESKKGNVTDNYWGTIIDDPYQWLENDSSAETKAWIEKQNKLTDNYLSKIPFLPEIKRQLLELWNQPKSSGSFKAGNCTYFYKNEGLQNQSVLYQQKEGGQPEIFLDPNKLSVPGTTSFSGINFSADGSLAACQISEAGSDLQKVVVLNTSDKTGIDTLYNIRFSEITWKGNEGFYYCIYNNPIVNYFEPTQYHKLYFHNVSSAQQKDSLIFSDTKTVGNMIGVSITKNLRYLTITNANGLQANNELYIQNLSKPGSPMISIVNDFQSQNHIIDHEGGKLFILTNRNALNYKVVTVDVAKPSPENWKDLISETEDVLISVSRGGGKLFACYLKDAASLVKQYDENGNFERMIELPGLGTVSGFAGNKTDKEIYYTFTSYIRPATTFKYNIASGKSEVFKKADELAFFDPEKYESKQVIYTSKDGTKVPMTITYRKGIKKNGKNPTLLYGYGGFNACLTPAFNISNTILLDNGGILAVANLRGGREYGEKWHLAGERMNKQNVFDDYIAGAEYLIANKYTSSEYLAAHGISNGGLLMGAVLTQRPELFKVVLLDVGLLDMLRYHKFCAGALLTTELGTAEESREMFEYLLKYSPYHALKKGEKYPATLITTADHDNSASPFSNYKFASRLQEYQKGNAPVLIRIESNVGHGYGKPTLITIEEAAEQWAFMFHTMGLTLR